MYPGADDPEQRATTRRPTTSTHDGAAARQIAEHGVNGASGRLPYHDVIQAAFGDVDISGIRAQVGGAATSASNALGGRAYTVGNQIGFAEAPDLHTAAHEAAHVVQQRGGVRLAGGVGAAGDALETHADRVADAVVAGEPAQYLLQQVPSGSGGPAVQLKHDLPKGDAGFKKMWEAHPHNDDYGPEVDTSSDEVREQHGLPDYVYNTCAVRLSIMLNGIGETITPAKVKAAGGTRAPHYSPKTKQYYILAAKEMWSYLTAYYRAPDVTFPPKGKRFATPEEWQASFDTEIKPLLAGKKGIVAFDKIFGYGGTGHVDLFDGEALSDSSGWYQSQRLLLWYVSVPPAGAVGATLGTSAVQGAVQQFAENEAENDHH